MNNNVRIHNSNDIINTLIHTNIIWRHKTMVEDNVVLKDYYLWSDIQLLTDETILKIPRKNMEEQDGRVYDSVSDNYVDPPLLYCHIIDLEILEEQKDYQLCKVVKVKGIGY